MTNAVIRAFAIVFLGVALWAPAARAEDLTPAQLEAAGALVDVMHIDVMMTQSLELRLESQMRTNPELEPFRDTMRAFFEEHMSWEALRPAWVTLYAKAFTVAELKKMTKYYGSELGQKEISLSPTLMAAVDELGRGRVIEHRAELDEMIRVRAAELTAEKE